MKRLLSAFVSFLLITIFSSIARADGVRPPAPTVGNPATNNVATASMPMRMQLQPMTASLDITGASCGLTEDSSAYLRLSAYTAANEFCDIITNGYTLQKWNGSSWVNYYTTSISDYDCATFTSVTFKNVVHGAYYRLVSSHRVYYGSQYDSTSLTTDYIYVN